MDTSVCILAVDDVELNLDLIEVMLKGPSGLDDVIMLRAMDGRQALDIMEMRYDVDLILLDLEMPVMDGFDALKILKRHERLREIPVIVVTADKSEIHKTLSLGANDFLTKPYDPQELKLRVMNHVRNKKLADIQKDMNSALESEVVKKTAALQKALDLSKQAEYEISLRLGKAAEFRDTETGLHTLRISRLAHELAVMAGLTAGECELLLYAAPLHDVGKMGIPDQILLKPGKLTEDELEIMRTHAMIGGKILCGGDRFPVINAGRIVAEQHHERWDGKGYPQGLGGTDIHIFGRIVMVVDVFDALTSERPYKKAFSLEKAVEIMMNDRETFFDPHLLDIFMANLDRFVAIKASLTENGEGQVSASHLMD
jgi:putative two-component system response regulator